MASGIEGQASQVDWLRVLELVRWPAVVIFLGVAAGVAFRGELRNWIAKVRRVNFGKAGFEIGSGAEDQAPQGAPEGADAAEKLLEQFTDQLVVEQEELIAGQLDQQGIPAGQPRDRVLRRYLAGFILGYQFEVAYRLLFGSQITLLQALNEAPVGLELDDVKPWFDRAAAQWKQLEVYGFDPWLNFLSIQLMTVREGDTVQISIRGRAFLAYLINSGLRLNKGG